MPKITVIIPTLCSLRRAAFLKRAIDSVLAQNASVQILIVANGNSVNESLMTDLDATAGVQVLRVAEGSLPKALAVGRRAIETPFFSELDDDDEMLPGTLTSRLTALNADTSLDAIICNAILRMPTGDEYSMTDVETVEAAPLKNLMRSNWMVPGCALFRSSTVTENFFGCIPMYLEWTYLGMRLANEARLRFSSDVGCIHHVGLHASLNESLACKLGRPHAIRKLQRLPVPKTILESLRKKELDSWHDVADVYMEQKKYRAAWRAHLLSMRDFYGWKYLGFSRHLLGLTFHTASRGLEEEGRNP